MDSTTVSEGGAHRDLRRSNYVLVELAAHNTNMSDLDRLVNLYWCLLSVLRAGVPGDVVELGCNAGRTAVFFGMLLESERSTKELHLYDSFVGLPEPSSFDAHLKEGECAATVEEVRQAFDEWGVPVPALHAGWFSETLPHELPDQIAFAYLDGDFYESILTSLDAVWPRLAPGGSVVIDDYADVDLNPRAWGGLPGVKRACDEFFEGRPHEARVLVGSGDLAFVELRKP